MKRKSERQAEKRAAREMAALLSEEKAVKEDQPLIKCDPSCAPEVKRAPALVTVADEASAGETSAPRKSRMRRLREFMEEERKAAEQELRMNLSQKEQELLSEKEKTATMQKEMGRLLGTMEQLKQNLAEEKACSALKTRRLHEGMNMLRGRSSNLERQLAETKCQAAAFSDENERLRESLGKERQRVASLQGRLSLAEAKTRSAAETCSCLEELLEQTQVCMVDMANNHLTVKQVLEQNQKNVEAEMVLEMEEARNGRVQAESALVQVQASMVAIVKQNIREKQILLGRLSKEEDKSRLSLQAYSQAEEALAAARTSMVTLEAQVESLTGQMKELMDNRDEEVSILKEEKIQAVAAKGWAEKSLAQAQASLREMEHSQLEAEKGWIKLMVHYLEEISCLDQSTLHTLCLQWQVSSNEQLERKDRDWRRKMEKLDIQMKELEGDKKQAETDLQLALSQIQAISDGFLGSFLITKAKKRMERRRQNES